MSNERIDLTGFEGFTRDEWSQNGWHIGPNLIAELKRCYYEIDLLREYAKCVECGGQYIGPVDYGSHEWNHSEDCYYKASE